MSIEGHSHSNAIARGAIVNNTRGSHILRGDPKRLVDGNVIVTRTPHHLPAQHFPNLTEHVTVAHQPRCNGMLQLTGLSPGRNTRIDEETRDRDNIVVGFTRGLL